MLKYVRIRLSTLLLLMVIFALLLKVYTQDQKIQNAQRVMPGDILALQIDGVLPPKYTQAFKVTDGERITTVKGVPVVVTRDGTIGLPKIGTVKVEGLLPLDIKQILEDALAANGFTVGPNDVKVAAFDKRSQTLLRK